MGWKPMAREAWVEGEGRQRHSDEGIRASTTTATADGTKLALGATTAAARESCPTGPVGRGRPPGHKGALGARATIRGGLAGLAGGCILW